MTTALGIITSGMRKAGVLTKNETPSADEAQDGLEMLNDLMESHSNEGLMVYARTLESFALTAGQTDYTIGTGGDFNTTRPVHIADAYVRQGTTDYPVGIIRDESYADITTKNTGSIPYFLNFTNEYPLATIKLYPSPSSGWTLFLLNEKPLETFTLNEVVSLPVGWLRYLKNQMAVEMSGEYGQEAPRSTYEVASRAIANIRRGSARAKTMDWGPNGGGMRNIYTGWNY